MNASRTGLLRDGPARRIMTEPVAENSLSRIGARTLAGAFHAYRETFQAITERARIRFEERDWQGMRADATERLDLYKNVIGRIESDMRRILDSRVEDPQVWAAMKTFYSRFIATRHDWELAETFFNSVTRRIFATAGVNRTMEFVDTDFKSPPTASHAEVFHTHVSTGSLVDLVASILGSYPLSDHFQDIARDVEWVAGEIESRLKGLGLPGPIDRSEMVAHIFYRGMGAYIIGRLRANSELIPLGIALLNSPEGVAVDAVLVEENQISILFSFTRSYFHVAADRPYDLVKFLKTILPRKRISELYISMGFNKHGKTELYRELLEHLAASPEDRFEISRGEPGLVMIVFNMAEDDLVFKLIRDRFATPKKVSRQGVMKKYDLVFRHDRAGRLVDAQAFEHLKFDLSRFSPELTEELRREAAKTVRFGEDHLVVEHAYVERRVTPLNLYLQTADGTAAKRVVMDLGRAIKDLAVSNIFPGDVLLKNFGVTRHGRVVFYDYDEICFLTTCHFRELPQSSHDEDELSDEPWFYVGEQDVFPEEFVRFLGLAGPLRELFLEHHGDLFDVSFWRTTQKAIEAGEFFHIFPYDSSQRRRCLSAAPQRSGEPTGM